MSTPRLSYTVEQAAEYLSLTPEEFDRDVRPHISSFQIGRQALIRAHELERVAAHLDAVRQAANRQAALLEKARSRRRAPGFVYFVQAGSDGPVKIGYAIDPEERLCALQTAHYLELRILGTMPGTIADEHELHRAFADERIRGEWFTPSERLLAFAVGRRWDGTTGDLGYLPDTPEKGDAGVEAVFG